MYIYIIYIVYIISDPWHRVLKSHNSKMGIIYMQSWKHYALPVIITMALSSLMHLGTILGHFVETHAIHALDLLLSYAQLQELPQSHCRGNQEGTMFWWLLHIFTRTVFGPKTWEVTKSPKSHNLPLVEFFFD